MMQLHVINKIYPYARNCFYCTNDSENTLMVISYKDDHTFIQIYHEEIATEMQILHHTADHKSIQDL